MWKEMREFPILGEKLMDHTEQEIKAKVIPEGHTIQLAIILDVFNHKIQFVVILEAFRNETSTEAHTHNTKGEVITEGSNHEVEVAPEVLNHHIQTTETSSHKIAIKKPLIHLVQWETLFLGY